LPPRAKAAEEAVNQVLEAPRKKLLLRNPMQRMEKMPILKTARREKRRRLLQRLRKQHPVVEEDANNSAVALKRRNPRKPSIYQCNSKAGDVDLPALEGSLTPKIALSLTPSLKVINGI
jgi:hypothetical protein